MIASASTVLASSSGARPRLRSFPMLGPWLGQAAMATVRLAYPPRLARLARRASTLGYLAATTAAIAAEYG